MVHYRVTKTLISTQESDWAQLVQESLGRDVHPKRSRGFCLAREALRQCCLAEGITLSIQELKVGPHHVLQGQTQLTISLSHSGDWGAAFIASADRYRSIGIDIEPLARVVKPEILSRVSHPEDLQMEAISLWALKEASFKAIMNTENFETPVEFSSILISQNKWSHSPSGLEGEWELSQYEDLVVARAWLKI